MGNQLAKAVTTRPAELLSDLPNVVYKDTLGGGRVLKTFVCVHDDGGLVVVKVYLKREGSPDLGSHKEELERIRDCLGGLSCPHPHPLAPLASQADCADRSADDLQRLIGGGPYPDTQPIATG